MLHDDLSDDSVDETGDVDGDEKREGNDHDFSLPSLMSVSGFHAGFRHRDTFLLLFPSFEESNCFFEVYTVYQPTVFITYINTHASLRVRLSTELETFVSEVNRHITGATLRLR